MRSIVVNLTIRVDFIALFFMYRSYRAIDLFRHAQVGSSHRKITVYVRSRSRPKHIDRMASYLAPYGNSDAIKVARELDAKVERVLTAAAK